MLKKIPSNILLGFSSSSYQIEGGWEDDGKGENIWDRFTHTQPQKIKDKSTGDVACDFYNKFRDDVLLMRGLNCQIYRFSLSWSRILPTGFCNNVNMAGINFYKNLIDELIKNNIEPMITLYHWDLPQPLQDLGGWPNPILADYFCDYAEVAFKYFGDKVKKWITFNEPEICALASFGYGVFAPGIALAGIADYLAGHTILKAHAKAYHLYDKHFRQKQKGEVGISISMVWKEPRTDSPKDLEAAQNSMQFQIGWIAHPIFTDKGDYPEIMKKRVAEESKKQGYPRSRLPEFDQYWINYIKGTSDFFGFNHYTTTYASHVDTSNPPEEHLRLKSDQKDLKVILSVSPEWEKVNNWLYVVPWGFRKCLKWIKDNYKNPKIYVTENGTLDRGTLEDNSRILYFNSYLSEMLKAINEDGCRVQVYTAWTLTDNFEWDKGYTERFGLYHVDFRDPSRNRTPKKSVKYIKNIFTTRTLQNDLDFCNLLRYSKYFFSFLKFFAFLFAHIEERKVLLVHDCAGSPESEDKIFALNQPKMGGLDARKKAGKSGTKLFRR